MSENVFVGADSFRRLLLGAAGGYELQGRHEAAETVLRVIDALDELTTGGKGGDRADEDQEAMAAAETVRLYCEKRRKTGCCGENCIFDKGNKGALCPLYGSPLIIEATPADGGPKEIFCALCKFHAESVEAWNAQYKRKEHT